MSACPGMGGGSAGFSRNASIVRPSGPTLTMPKAEASLRGTGMAATVTPAPWRTWGSIICCGSIRSTASAPRPRDAPHRHARTVAHVVVDHLLRVHPVHVIGAEDDHDVRPLVVDQV